MHKEDLQRYILPIMNTKIMYKGLPNNLAQ